MKKTTDKTWKFLHKRNGKLAESLMRIDTAENVSAGHSMTTNNLHCSEVQAWAHGDLLLRGLLPMVPDDPDTMIVEEGTGSGVGDFWYERVELARNPEQSGWEFVFVPWFERDDAFVEFDEGEKFRFEKSLDSTEKLLFESGVSLEKLHWRRRKLEEEFKGDLDGFKQQFPADPDEAFLSSGRPVFNQDIVRKKLHESKSGTRGYLRRKDKGVVFDPDKHGYWQVWENPVKDLAGNLYCCGADVAEGIEIIPELGNRGGDYSTARVLRRDERRFVATFHARVDTDVFADELAKCAIYFGTSLLPEQNAGGGGNTVISRLRDYAGVRLLKTPSFGKKRLELKSDEVGWETLKNTKRVMIDEMIQAIREGSYTDPDKEVWYECSTYVKDEKGRTNAQSRKFDDLVIATAITLQADRLLPMYFRPEEKREREVTRDMDGYEERSVVTQEGVMEKVYAEF